MSGGIAGFRAYIRERILKETGAGQNEELEKEHENDDVLYEALFGLARLFISQGDSSVNLSPWVADLLGSEDYFLPCLLLLEAYKEHSEKTETGNYLSAFYSNYSMFELCTIVLFNS